MPEVYYYVSPEKVSDIIECGLKLSAFYDKAVLINNETRLCFTALLNPRDDEKKYKCESYTCLKVQVKSTQCFVADRFIYETMQGNEQGLELYYKSIIPIDQYVFGRYRLPECLIITTILPGEAGLLDKRMDSPILYTNSEELYINNTLQEFRDGYQGIDDYLLYYFFDKLAESEKLDKIENNSIGTTVFKDNETGRIYCIKKPEIDDIINQASEATR